MTHSLETVPRIATASNRIDKHDKWVEILHSIPLASVADLANHQYHAVTLEMI